MSANFIVATRQHGKGILLRDRRQDWPPMDAKHQGHGELFRYDNGVGWGRLKENELTGHGGGHLFGHVNVEGCGGSEDIV